MIGTNHTHHGYGGTIGVPRLRNRGSSAPASWNIFFSTQKLHVLNSKTPRTNEPRRKVLSADVLSLDDTILKIAWTAIGCQYVCAPTVSDFLRHT